jgi:hypothetical protein
MNNAVIMALDFFEIFNGFEEEGKTDQAAREKYNCKHNNYLAGKGQNGCQMMLPATGADPGGWDGPGNPVKMEKIPPK